MTNKIPTIIIDSDNNSNEVTRLYLEETNSYEIIETYTTAMEGYNSILENRPAVVFIDISQNTDLILEIVNKISNNHKTCKIIVTSENCSTDIVIKAMRAGAREFIPKPLIKEEFIKTVEKMKEQVNSQNSEKKKCRIISTFSNKGGIGKTVIATNLALELANLTKEKVALIDLNLQLGDITTFLDINPSFDVSYVVQNLSRLDETFILSTLEKYKDTSLYVLADPPYLEQAEDITADQIAMLFEALKESFSYIIVDTSSNFDGKTITALDQSDLILLISVVNLPSIRNCQRCLDLFERLGYEKEKTKIIINRFMENEEIKVEDVEDVLNKKIYWKIPNNYFTIMSAINKGIPVSIINAESNISKNYKELAALLSDNIYKQDYGKNVQRKSGFSFLKIFSKN